jgi:hypothetical protein
MLMMCRRCDIDRQRVAQLKDANQKLSFELEATQKAAEDLRKQELDSSSLQDRLHPVLQDAKAALSDEKNCRENAKQNLTRVEEMLLHVKVARDQAEAKYANLKKIHLRNTAQFESNFKERERVIGECKKRSEDRKT